MRRLFRELFTGKGPENIISVDSSSHQRANFQDDFGEEEGEIKYQRWLSLYSKLRKGKLTDEERKEEHQLRQIADKDRPEEN